MKGDKKMKQTEKTISKTLIVTIILLVLASSMTPIAFAKQEKTIKIKEDGFILQEKVSKDVIRFIEVVPIHVEGFPDNAFYTVNVYAINTGKAVTLIDCGTEDLAERLYERVRLSFRRKAVEVVLLTHGHADHAGGGAYFQSKGADVIVGAYDLGMVMTGNSDAPYDDFRYSGYVPDYTYDDYVPKGFNVIPTPGHTMGSVSILYKGKNYLFTGDTGLPYVTEDVGPLDFTYELDYGALVLTAEQSTIPLEMQIDSLNSLLSTLSKRTTMCPGHKGVYKGEQAKINIMTAIETINSVMN